MLFKYSGKYVNIYFNMKITFPVFGVTGVTSPCVAFCIFVRLPFGLGVKVTIVYHASYPISTLPEHIHSTILSYRQNYLKTHNRWKRVSIPH